MNGSGADATARTWRRGVSEGGLGPQGSPSCVVYGLCGTCREVPHTRGQRLEVVVVRAHGRHRDDVEHTPGTARIRNDNELNETLSTDRTKAFARWGGQHRFRLGGESAADHGGQSRLCQGSRDPFARHLTSIPHGTAGIRGDHAAPHLGQHGGRQHQPGAGIAVERSSEGEVNADGHGRHAARRLPHRKRFPRGALPPHDAAETVNPRA